MKITVSIYNDDESATRDIQVIELVVGQQPKRTVIEPIRERAANMASFRIVAGDTLIVTATGS